MIKSEVAFVLNVKKHDRGHRYKGGYGDFERGTHGYWSSAVFTPLEPKSFQHQVMQVPEITVGLGGEVPDEVWDAHHWEETPR